MKLKAFRIFAYFSIFSLFAGCSNIFDSKAENAAQADSSNGELKISISSPARYISSYSFDLSKEGWSWSLTYREDASEGKSIYTPPPSGTNTPSLSYSNGTLTATNIPAGTYTITIEGTLSDSGTSCKVTGSKSGVKIEQGGSTKENIFVGLAKTSDGSGGLSLTLESADASNYFSNISNAEAKLTSRSKGKVYSNLDENPVISWNTDNGYVLSADEIPSGWYSLSFTLDGYSFILSDTEIEIADGLTTSGTISVTATATASKAYYATNSESDGNGLSVSSRANLTTLLDSLPSAQSVSIFVDGDPEIDLYALSKLESKLADNQNENQTVIIYNASNSESMKVKVTSEYDAEYNKTYKGTVESISNALTLKGSTVDKTDYKTVDVGQIDTSNASFTITLVDGAAINLTNTNANTYLTNTLGINAMVSTGSTTTLEDNLSAYYKMPFVTFSTSSVPNKMFDVTEGYGVSYTENDGSYAYYITYVAMKTGSEINETLTSITEKYSGDTLTFTAYTDILTAAELEAKTTATLSADDSITPCYAWLDSDNSTVYYYAAGYTDSEETHLILLNADSSYMFKNCVFTEIDMSGFSSKSVKTMSWMFYGCSSLATIYAASNADWSSVGSSTLMFYKCANLVGGNGTKYDSTNVDAAYARIDTTDNPGYFTAKSSSN